MKNLTTLALTFFLLLNIQNKAMTNTEKIKDSVTCLVIKGKINNADEGLDKQCKVELITNQGVLETILLQNGKKQFSFKLQKNSYYAIRVSKDGFLTKLISVNTAFPADVDDVCNFAFNTELMTDVLAKELNQDALDFPIAIIHFEPHSEMFIYNKEYTDNIKKEIYETGNSQESKVYATAQVN